MSQLVLLTLVLAWAALVLGGARGATAGSRHDDCRYTPEIAEALRQAHPEADVDHGADEHTHHVFQKCVRSDLVYEHVPAADFERAVSRPGAHEDVAFRALQAELQPVTPRSFRQPAFPEAIPVAACQIFLPG